MASGSIIRSGRRVGTSHSLDSIRRLRVRGSTLSPVPHRVGCCHPSRLPPTVTRPGGPIPNEPSRAVPAHFHAAARSRPSRRRLRHAVIHRRAQSGALASAERPTPPLRRETLCGRVDTAHRATPFREPLLFRFWIALLLSASFGSAGAVPVAARDGGSPATGEAIAMMAEYSDEAAPERKAAATLASPRPADHDPDSQLPLRRLDRWESQVVRTRMGIGTARFGPPGYPPPYRATGPPPPLTLRGVAGSSA